MTLVVATPHGPAHVELREATRPRGALLLGHGAGGSVAAPDLQAAAAAALDVRVSVALVTQPYRVAGRRNAAPPAQLDAAWLAVVAALRAGPLKRRRLVFGGRSSGARVACRTARAGRAAGVLCLAFPLLPPARAGAKAAPVPRLPELDAPEVPVLVVQGAGDRFGVPGPAPGREVLVLRGDHGLKAEHDRLREAVGAWLPRVLAPR